PPLSRKSRTLSRPMPRTAAGSDGEDGKAAAGPILRPPAEGRGRRRSRAAVAVHEQRRKLAGERGEIGVLRSVEQTVRPQPIIGLERHRLGYGEILLVILHLMRRRPFQYRSRPGCEV